MFDLEILGEVKFLVERLQDLYPVIRYLLNVRFSGVDYSFSESPGFVLSLMFSITSTT